MKCNARSQTYEKGFEKLYSEPEWLLEREPRASYSVHAHPVVQGPLSDSQSGWSPDRQSFSRLKGVGVWNGETGGS